MRETFIVRSVSSDFAKVKVRKKLVFGICSRFNFYHCNVFKDLKRKGSDGFMFHKNNNCP